VLARSVLLAVAAVLVLTAPASAFTPPELFVRLQHWDTHEGTGEWIPLASAPQLNDLRGYQVGYRLQPSGKPNELQRAALTVAAVPDGRPTQPNNAAPYCVARIGTAGAIVDVGSELQFEGNGTYTVSVAVGEESGGASGCLAGPSSSGSFTVDVHVALQRVGDPLVYRSTPLPGDPFVGLRANDPPGGHGEVRCALDATVGADGAPAGRKTAGEGPVLNELGFPEPGAWTCAARGTREGLGDEHERMVFGTAWSPPQTFDVRSDVQLGGRLSGARKARPRLLVAPRFGAAAAGGRVTLTLKRFLRCRKRRAVTKTAGRYRATLDKTGRAWIAFARPRKKPGYYLAVVAFGGTRFLRAGSTPVHLEADRRSIVPIKRELFPRC